MKKESKIKSKLTIKRMIAIALFTAICFVGTQLKIEVPLGGGTDTMVHLGTTAIFLASIFIGPAAGISAGIGCALFDMMSPKHVAWAIPTLIIKGLTGYSAGKICFARGAQGNSKVQNVIAFIVGGIISLLGYFLCNWFIFYGLKPAIIKMIASLTTTGIGIIIAIPLSFVLKPIINKSDIKIYE